MIRKSFFLVALSLVPACGKPAATPSAAEASPPAASSAASAAPAPSATPAPVASATPAASAASATTASSAAPAAVAAAPMTVTPYADVKWQPLNPKDPKGIQISLVAGDMAKGPVTFFMKFAGGGKSPVHVHTNDYYGIVVQGAPTHGLNEKDPGKPLAVGSTWFQPGNAAHYDSCTGKQDCIVLLHYPNGGFDFALEAPAGAKATGKMTVTPYAATKWQPLNPKDPKGIQVSMVAGDMAKGPVTFFMKFAGGGKSPVHGHTNDYYGIVTHGAPTHGLSDKDPGKPLAVGSTWFQPGKALHFDSCTGKQDCVVLLHYPTGGFDFFMAPEASTAAAK